MSTDVVFVYTLGSLLRVSVSNAASKIMFNDLPSVDAILDMCHVRCVECCFRAGRSVARLICLPCPPVPLPLRMLALQDVYIAREFGGHVMEEELFRELIELYRDPAALIEISKVKGD